MFDPLAQYRAAQQMVDRQRKECEAAQRQADAERVKAEARMGIIIEGTCRVVYDEPEKLEGK